jgi:hypothetical protein
MNSLKPTGMPLIRVQISRSDRACAELIEAFEKTFATTSVTEVKPLDNDNEKNENLESQSEQQAALRTAR